MDRPHPAAVSLLLHLQCLDSPWGGGGKGRVGGLGVGTGRWVSEVFFLNFFFCYFLWGGGGCLFFFLLILFYYYFHS